MGFNSGFKGLRKPLYKMCSNVRRVQIMLGPFLTPKLEVEK
jgi:hypothetical protein